MPIHMADIGSDNFEQEFTLSLMENDGGTLAAIETSLERIEEGSYGQCDECGVKIPQEPAERDPLRDSVRALRRAAGKQTLKAAVSAQPLSRVLFVSGGGLRARFGIQELDVRAVGASFGPRIRRSGSGRTCWASKSAPTKGPCSAWGTAGGRRLPPCRSPPRWASSCGSLRPALPAIGFSPSPWPWSPPASWATSTIASVCTA